MRSERQLMVQLDFSLLFRWFVGLGFDDPVWDASTFSKNHDRLLDGSVGAAFSSAVLSGDTVNPSGGDTRNPSPPAQQGQQQ